MNIMLTDIRSLSLDMQEIPVIEQGADDSFNRLLRQQYPMNAESGSQVIEIKGFFEDVAGSAQAPEIKTSSVPSISWQDYLSQQQIRITTDSNPVNALPIDLATTLRQPAQPVVAGDDRSVAIAGQELPAGGKLLPDGSIIGAEIPFPEIRPEELRLGISTAMDSRPAVAVDSLRIASPKSLPTESAVVTSTAVGIIPGGRNSNAAELSPKLVDSTSGRAAESLSASDSRLEIQVPASVERVKTGEPAAAVKLPTPVPPAVGSRSDMVSYEVTNRELSGDRRVDTQAPGVSTAREPGGREIPLSRPLSTQAEIPAKEPLSSASSLPQSGLAPAGEIALATDPRDASRALLQPLKNISEAVPAEFAANRNAELPAQVATNQSPQTMTLPAASGVVQAAIGTSATPMVNQNLLPPHLETLSLARSADTPQWGDGLGERVSWMINQKQNSASIRLDPPMLGKLDVQVKIADDATTITIQTQHAQTRELIESASLRLRDFLQESGYQNVNVDVSQRQDQQQARAQASGEEAQEDAEEMNHESLAQQQQSQYFNGDGLLDTFA